MILDKADEVTEELFQSLLYRREIGLETPMKGSDFVFDCVRNVLWFFIALNHQKIGAHILRK